MQSEQFTVQNVKCGGCVSAIEDGLKAMDGVAEVSVTIESGLIDVRGESLERATLSARLAELGYPEA